MKVLNIIFIILFLIAAALQYNDPDPYLWIPIYAYGAFLCYKALRKEYKPLLFIIGIVLYSSYAIYLLLEENGVISWVSEHDTENITLSMKATKPWIENTREFFGLIILIFALAINMLWLSRRRVS